MCDFVNLLFKFNIYVLSSRFKEFQNSKNDNSHLFEMVLKCLFHAWEVTNNEIYKQHFFFLTCTCVLMLLCILQWIW